MLYNLKRHKLLGELARLISLNDDFNNDKQKASEVGMTFEHIDKFLKVSKYKREIILSELLESKEILLCEFPKNVKGYFINNPIGVSSFSNRKYIKKNEDIFIKWFRNFVQIFIPIASLTITIIILLINPKDSYEKLDKELQTIKQKLEYIEKVQYKKEQNPNVEIHKTE